MGKQRQLDETIKALQVIIKFATIAKVNMLKKGIDKWKNAFEKVKN
jgi:hypothetical protein